VIPYFHIPSLDLVGPFAIQPFGALVAVGILVGAWLAQKLAVKEGVNLDEMRSAIAWAVVVGFIGAHLVAVLLYHPERISREGPLVLLAIWDGISSYGGFFGALVGLILFYRKQKTPWLHQAEIIAQALIVGWIFGRTACFVAYDHPGAQTDFFLAQEYRDGTIRHNLGLYEMLFTLLVIGPAILLIRRFNPRQGAIILTISLLYAPVRFGLDFLRATDLQSTDKRYLHLTPAQWSCFALIALGVWAYSRGKGRPRLHELIAAAQARPAAAAATSASRPSSGGSGGGGGASSAKRTGSKAKR
jgi:phosphatidylglycerol:prolipoprotein diacylglycerol transferase